ncbi:MAG TPA: alpha/beta hydrolase, partial [Desulfosarcina sp.]|nr:alpha/beta hydrolase [Desulfosarcina sp.]
TLAAHVFCEDLTRRSIRAARRRYREGDLKPRLRVYHGDNTDGAFWGWNDVWLHADFVHWDIKGSLAGIRVPLLAIQGTDDPYGSQAQLDAIAELGGAAVAVAAVPGCAHAPHLEKTDLVLDAIAEFVDRHIRIGG